LRKMVIELAPVTQTGTSCSSSYARNGSLKLEVVELGNNTKTPLTRVFKACVQ
jgi:hypothetical protein